jgi:hypothetical protein
MLRTFSLLAVVAACLLLPAGLFAGGPPLLCLPVDGVTPDNAAACAELLSTNLKDILWPPDRGIEIQQHSNQWYFTLYMDKAVGLNEVEAALKGSSFSIPRAKLRFFGHVILELDARAAARDALLADLNALIFVSVGESVDRENLVLVTLDMPSPVREGDRDRKSVGWSTFRRNDLSTGSDRSPATAGQLPSLDAFRDIAAKHNARLENIHWSVSYVCRALGCVAAPASDKIISPEAALLSGKWDVEFSNGVTQVCEIGNDATAVVNEPQRKSRGTVVVTGGSTVMTFHDDRVERWTAVGKRFVVEHWFPSSRFPTANPVHGIAERAD